MTHSPLVSTEWLAEHLDDPHVRIVDIRGHVAPATEPPPHYFNHYDAYLVSHLPGAVFIDWVREITDPDDPRHAQIAKPERYAEAMSRHGIGDETLVVAYDDGGDMFAARLWWSLSYYGHTEVAVLDGGWDKWVREGRPVTAELPSMTPAVFTPRINPALRISGDEVLAKLDTSARLLDMRSTLEYDGKASRAERFGHIPGALSSPRQTLRSADGVMLAPEQLRAAFAQVGVDETTRDVVLYCNGGVSASYGLLALRVAGLEGGVLYDGSWKDWGNDPTKPVETPEEPGA